MNNTNREIIRITKWHVVFSAIFLFWGTQAFAHAAEQGFVLLLPTEIYISAGTASVALSILLISAVSSRFALALGNSHFITTRDFGLTDWLSALCTFALFFLLWIGYSGPRDPLSNLLPLGIWILWWACMVSLSPLLGNFWHHINPWSGVYAFTIGKSDPPFQLPPKTATWPAVIVFILFNGFAVADVAPNDPYRLSLFVGGYWLFTFIGMLLFGGKTWLRSAECFTVFFGLIAKIAPFSKGRIGFPGWQFHQENRVSMSLAAFCVCMLGTGSFDGLHETFWWLAKIGINPLEFPGRSAVIATSWVGMIATCVLLGLTLCGCTWLGIKLTRNSTKRFRDVFPLFALSLVPIAVGYHIAHYLPSFLVGIQYAVIAISDPFAAGNNWFGTATWRVTTGFLSDPQSVKLIWLTQATSVVVSHILAVLIAHRYATVMFAKKKDIILCQAPLSILMVCYTVFGLWLLASPRGV